MALEFTVDTGVLYKVFRSDVQCVALQGVMRNAITAEDAGSVTASGSAPECFSIQWGGDGGITCEPKKGRASAGCRITQWSGCGGNVLRKIIAAPWPPETKLLHLNYGYNAANTQGGNCTAKGAGNKSPSKLKDCCCRATAFVKSTCFTNEGSQGEVTDNADGYGDPSGVDAAIPQMPVSCSGGNTLGGGGGDAITVATGPRTAPCPNRKDYTILSYFGQTLCCKNPSGLPGAMACDLHVGPFALTKHDTGGGPWTCANGESYQYLAPVSGPNDTCGFEALAGADLCGTSGYFPEPCANPFAGITSDTFSAAIVAGCKGSAGGAISQAIDNAFQTEAIKQHAKDCEKLKPGCSVIMMTLDSVSVSCYECPDPVAFDPLDPLGPANPGPGLGGPTITDPKFDIPTNPGPSDPGGI